MTLLKLDVLGVRNIHSATLQPSPMMNFVVGANGSGKSALLEAIFILGRARSFRTHHIKQAIAFNQSELIVSAQTRDRTSTHALGIRVDGKQCDIRVNQENGQKADLAYTFPVQLIHPKSYRLLDAGPQLRREFIDWGAFNDNRNFLMQWRMFSKALQQRNAVLKSRQIRQLDAWDAELVRYGNQIDTFRRRYMAALQPMFIELVDYFLGIAQNELRFDGGWHRELTLEQALKNDRDRDLRYGFTHSGPHRADFLAYHQNRLAKDYLSRGQQKLMMLALMLAQVALINQSSPRDCCILIDDLASELDTVNTVKLLKYLDNLKGQVFMTGTDLTAFGNLNELNNYKVFHVEQGRIQIL